MLLPNMRDHFQHSSASLNWDSLQYLLINVFLCLLLQKSCKHHQMLSLSALMDLFIYFSKHCCRKFSWFPLSTFRNFQNNFQFSLKKEQSEREVKTTNERGDNSSIAENIFNKKLWLLTLFITNAIVSCFLDSFLHRNLPFVMFLLLFTSGESSTIFFVHWKCKYCSCRWVNKKKTSKRVDDIDYLWKYMLRTLQKRLSKEIETYFRTLLTFFSFSRDFFGWFEY